MESREQNIKKPKAPAFREISGAFSFPQTSAEMEVELAYISGYEQGFNAARSYYMAQGISNQSWGGKNG